MSINRITVRTFQNEQHAEMFILMAQRIAQEATKEKFKTNMKVVQNKSLKNQVTSIWQYDDDKHVKEVRSYLSKHSALPNSLSPKEVVYFGDVVIDTSAQ